MREIHKKTVTEADLILKQMQTARDQRVGAEEERVQDDVQNEERTEVQREERGGEGIQDEGTMEQILDSDSKDLRRSSRRRRSLKRFSWPVVPWN